MELLEPKDFKFDDTPLYGFIITHINDKKNILNNISIKFQKNRAIVLTFIEPLTGIKKTDRVSGQYNGYYFVFTIDSINTNYSDNKIIINSFYWFP